MTEARDTIRGRILNHIVPKSNTVEFFGEQIEVRQPSLGVVLDSGDTNDRKAQIVNLMLSYCYVPGTDEKVFEEGDADALLALPFGPDVSRLQKAITDLTTIDVAEALGN